MTTNDALAAPIQNGNRTVPVRRLFTFLLVLGCLSPVNLGQAQEAQWIWTTEHAQNEVPHVACHFRKVFQVRAPEQGQVTIYVDDAYELFVNGRRVGAGNAEDHLHDHDISRFLSNGRNVIGIKVSNTHGSTAGVAARVMVREHESGWRSFLTDDSWRSSLRPLPFWNTLIYNDARWPTVATLGRLGESAPGEAEQIAGAATAAPRDRLEVAKDFSVQQLIKSDDSGSLIAIAFNEFGQLIASQEGGPLLLIYDDNNNGMLDSVREYCKDVKNCQGILPLNGDVYVTGEGPDGAALYLLRDRDQDGVLEDVKSLLRFGEEAIEHGAHGLALGPDGLLYIAVGNQATAELKFASTGPYRNYYEGDLLKPRYEDPSGHAAGIAAPGGVILRTDLEGKAVELFAGGLRNPYDLVFDRHGELFVHDSDMESDIGTTWYRPTRLYHAVPGAELGWRSGWAKWPEYFVDTIPNVLETGRGSPTGAVCYNHFAFPTKYHGMLFLADWSEGQILAVKTEAEDGSYRATQEVFLRGQPLNVTDLAVGPEGGLYFSTGGRGTEGGVYRIQWQGIVPKNVSDLGEGMSQAIRYPQLDSAATRQQIARLKNKLGEEWNKQLMGVVRSRENPWYYRTRALELMQLFGPPPSDELLGWLTQDPDKTIRAKAAQLIAAGGGSETHSALRQLLSDDDPTVQRIACESLAALGVSVPLRELRSALKSDSRMLAWSARRLLELQPVEAWRDEILETDEQRLFIQGGLALVISQPDARNGIAVLDRFHELLDGFISDEDFLDMLRLSQVALHRCNLTAADVPQLSQALGEEFPSANDLMNRELVRLLMYLQVSEPIERYLAFLHSDAAQLEKRHLAFHLRFLENGWNLERRMRLIRFYESTADEGNNGTAHPYLTAFETDFAKQAPLGDGLALLDRGAEWPDAAIGVLYALPSQLDKTVVDRLKVVDRRLRGSTERGTERLRIGILAVMARSADEASLKYLRYVWDTEPERREVAVLGLAQDPDTNWEYLVRSLPILRGVSASEIHGKLEAVDIAPDEPEPYRQLILSSLRDDGAAAESALRLLAHWTGNSIASGITMDERIEIWQDWFASEYPEEPVAELPVESELSKWKFDDLYTHLTSEEGAVGSYRRGAAVFEKALCSKCHRFGNRGEPLGPDLTSISKRFMKREVLESIVFPSHVISYQYRSKSVITTSGRSYSGIVAAGSLGGVIVLDSAGSKHPLREADIDEIVPNRNSAMPERLLDQLTLTEISDLFAYLGVIPREAIASRRPGDVAR